MKIYTLDLSENEETEGSEGQAEYMFGDAELDDDDLYSMEHDNQMGQCLFFVPVIPCY